MILCRDSSTTMSSIIELSEKLNNIAIEAKSMEDKNEKVIVENKNIEDEKTPELIFKLQVFITIIYNYH